MPLPSSLPHAFIIVVAVVVAFFVLKSLIKFAIILGAVGLVVYLLWIGGVFGKFAGLALG